MKVFNIEDRVIISNPAKHNERLEGMTGEIICIYPEAELYKMRFDNPDFFDTSFKAEELSLEDGGGTWLLNDSKDNPTGFYGAFSTKEEAIEYARDKGEGPVYLFKRVGRFDPYIYADDILGKIGDNAYDIIGDAANEYTSRLDHASDEQELEIKLNKVLKEWLIKHELMAYRPFEVEDHGEIDVNTREAGALLSPESPKDYQIKNYLAMGAKTRPTEYVRQTMDILNQGNVNSCVAFATRVLVQWYAEPEWKEYGDKYGYSRSPEWSNEFIYHNRLKAHHQGQGMYPVECLNQLKKCGVCSYRTFPGNTEYKKGESVITEDMRRRAQSQAINSYARVNTKNPNEVMDTLLENGPFLASIPITKALMKCRNDYVKYDGTEDGYHAVVVFGYRQTNKGLELYIQNSWGRTWGHDGCAWLSADYRIVEAWSIVDKCIPPQSTKSEVVFTVGKSAYLANGMAFYMDTTPVIINGRTFLPARYLSAALNCSIQFLPKAGPEGSDAVYIYDYEVGPIFFYIGSTQYTINGKPHKTDAPPFIDENNRTMIPVRALGEALGFDVEYSDTKNNDGTSLKNITITRERALI